MRKRLLLKGAAEALGVTAHYLRTEAKAGRICHLRCGNRYIFDIEQCEEFLRNKAMENVKPAIDSIAQYGVLRKCVG